MTAPARRPTRFRRGQPLRQDPLNALVETTEALGQQFRRGQFLGPHAALAQFILAEEEGDYLVCRTYDGTDTGDTDILIAKPHLLRRSIASRDGITYTYTANSARNANDGVDSENQLVVPGWVVDDLIYAERVRRGTGVMAGDPEAPLVWLARADGRQWAKESS